MDGGGYENRRRTRRTLTWRETPVPQQKRIVFRTADMLNGTLDFYSIPLDFGNGDSSNSHTSSGEAESLKPFYKSGIMSQCSVFAAVGSSLFVAGGFVETPSYTGPTDNIYRFDTTFPRKDRSWYVSKMLSPRLCPHTMVIDGKLYIVGGGGSKSVGSDGRCYVAGGPWGEVFDPYSLKPSIPLPLPEYRPFLEDVGRCTLTAALHTSKRIFVASSAPSSYTAYGYDVVDRVWGELDHKVDFSAVQGQGKPAVVRNGTTLCWLAKSAPDVIHAYDLVLKTWFGSPIRGLDKVRGPDGIIPHGKPTNSSLFSLDDDHLCLLWMDDFGVHAWGGFGFDVFVVSSKTYVLEPQEQVNNLSMPLFLAEGRMMAVPKLLWGRTARQLMEAPSVSLGRAVGGVVMTIVEALAEVAVVWALAEILQGPLSISLCGNGTLARDSSLLVAMAAVVVEEGLVVTPYGEEGCFARECYDA
ncbi:hypothetical protein Vadar_033164 [Vaccinium darrowii]|uniref:Uncharacterized protein n=1 Tax=Vaccinium darrowii TaxID=229202 RepID=A0ACB7XMX7_9ERIC|nr:hypothetical protein Vadar_033164 [Vaccinium darrowii]